MDIIVAVAGVFVAVVAALIAYLQLRRTPRPLNLVESAPASLADTKPSSRVQHNLPSRPHIIGRTAEQARVSQGLRSTCPIVLITGLGGTGKSTLALAVGWSAAQRTTESLEASWQTVIWVDAEGKADALDTLIDSFAITTGQSYVHQLTTREQRLDRVAAFLKQTATLVIIDSPAPDDQGSVENYLVAACSGPSRAIVTSREQTYAGAWIVALGPLPEDDSRQLIKREATRLGLSALISETGSPAPELHAATGGNPLAILLTTAQMSEGGGSATSILAGLSDLNDAGTHEVFSTIYATTWHEVLRGDAVARVIMAAVAVHPGAAARSAVQSAITVSHDRFQLAIRRLIRLSLLNFAGTQGSSITFDLHPLTRVYVRRQLAAASAANDDPVTERLIDYYLVHATRFSDTYSNVENVSALGAERENITAFADLAYRRAKASNEPSEWRKVARFTEAMAPFLWGRGHWYDLITSCGRALEAAAVLDDPAMAVTYHVLLGRIHCWLDNTAKAEHELALASTLLGPRPTEQQQMPVWRLEAQIASREGNHDQAKALLSRVLDVAPLSVDDQGRAATLIELGIAAQGSGDWSAAARNFTEALLLDEQFGTVEGTAITLSYLGTAALELNDLDTAERHLQRGLSLSQLAGRLSSAGRCQIGLARIYLLQHRHDLAYRLSLAAADSFLKLGNVDRVADARLLAANARRSMTTQPSGTDSAAFLGRFRAVIFDCDDTLIATARTRWTVLIETAAQFGVLVTEADIRKAWGKPFDELIRTLVPTLDQPAFAASYRTAMRLHRPAPTPGARLLLAELFRRSVRMELLTSSSQDLVHQALHELAMANYFAHVQGYEQSSYHEPDPRVLKPLLDALADEGFKKHELLYVGDSFRDHRVAAGNGIDFIAVTTGLESRNDLLGCGIDNDRIFDSLEELMITERAAAPAASGGGP